MKKLLTMAFALAAVVAFIGFSATSSDAVHKGGGVGLTCGGCHTMHNSQGGGELGGDAGTGTAVLLRGASGATYTFCLACHAENGANAGAVLAPDAVSTPPKVLLANAATVSSAGNFNGTLVYATYAAGASDDNLTARQGYGHSIGSTLTNLTPPGGDQAMGVGVGLTCTSCHDPHGAPQNAWVTGGINLFRNLRQTPTGSGGPAITLNGVVGAMGSSSDGVAGAGQVWAGTSNTLPGHYWPNNNGVNNNIYYAGAASTSGGISAWCATCHDNWHEANVVGQEVIGGAGADWLRHPVDRSLAGDGTLLSRNGNTIVDTTTFGANQLPVADNSGAAPDDSLVATGSWTADDLVNDKVFCLSCHYAHGGPNFDNLRWNYLASVGPAAGVQVPNAVGAGANCNSCHNK